MHQRTKCVSSWAELIDFVESINPYKRTLLLEGWLNELHNDRLKIKSLIFTTKPVELLTFTEKKILSSGIDVVAKIDGKIISRKGKNG